MTQATPALDARARAALATEFARALESPGLRPLPPRLTGALLPRFARYYDQLLHLPRRTRRRSSFRFPQQPPKFPVRHPAPPCPKPMPRWSACNAGPRSGDCLSKLGSVHASYRTARSYSKSP